MREFAKGERIKTASGGELEIVEKLGEGGQGIVYKVTYNEKELALKWYTYRMYDPVRFYGNIENNIRKGPPTEAFLWPLEITEIYEGSFGYLMKLRPEEYKEFSQFLLAKVEFLSLEAMLNTALSITKGFRELHSRGFSYQDLNDGNFFVNPKNGDVLICDNDNVAPYGENLGIAGKCRYMAPEVVIGKKLPDIHTDRFSLAVILYLLLFRNHPLEGKRTMCPCLTEELERKFYGYEPVFVWDPNNDSNRPVRGVHTNERKFWPVFPDFIHDIFEEAFSYDALVGSDTQHRVQEKKWQEVFTRLKDITIKCVCKNETFIDITKTYCNCINCERVIKRFPILKVKKYSVLMAPNQKIYSCHTVYDSDDFKDTKGEVVTSINNPSVIGLKNTSDEVWNATLPNGTSKAYENGKVIKLGIGIKIDFGNGNIGEII